MSIVKEQADNYLYQFRRSISKNNDLIILACRHSGWIIGANNNALLAYGYTGDELYSLSIFNIDQNISSQTLANMDHIDSDELIYETIHRRKDGRIFPADVTLLNTLINGEKVLLSLIHDNTATANREINNNGRDSKEMLVQYEKLLTMRQITSEVMHEILNPLNIILMRVQLLEMCDGDILSEDAKKESLSICKSQIEKIFKISSDFIRFSRFSKREISDVNLKDLIDSILSLISQRLKSERIQIEEQCDEKLPYVKVDRDRISQVIINIMNNAIDALSEISDKKIKIIIERKITDRKAAALRIIFTDNGPGIKVEDLDRIFDPYFTTKDIGKGTGLGLSISQGIINDHEGRLWAENNESGGASFIMELPLVNNHKY